MQETNSKWEPLISEKEKLIKWLEAEKWYPLVKPTNIELETSILLNSIISDMVDRLNREKI